MEETFYSKRILKVKTRCRLDTNYYCIYRFWLKKNILQISAEKIASVRLHFIPGFFQHPEHDLDHVDVPHGGRLLALLQLQVLAQGQGSVELAAML